MDTETDTCYSFLPLKFDFLLDTRSFSLSLPLSPLSLVLSLSFSLSLHLSPLSLVLSLSLFLSLFLSAECTLPPRACRYIAVAGQSRVLLSIVFSTDYICWCQQTGTILE